MSCRCVTVVTNHENNDKVTYLLSKNPMVGLFVFTPQINLWEGGPRPTFSSSLSSREQQQG